MKTTLDLPEDLVREVKLHAVRQRRPMKDVVADFLRQGLGMAPTGVGELASLGTMVRTGEDGLPVIRCAPDAPAFKMSVLELLQLARESQTDEDLQRSSIAN